MSADPLMPAPADLDLFLAANGLRAMAEATLLRGGANNRVYRVAADPGRRQRGAEAAVLKVYFRRPGDAWDRFTAEKAFYRHAARSARGFLASPLGWDEKLRSACFEWVDGGGFGGRAIGGVEVAQAAEFVRQLQVNRDEAGLGPAAEARFGGAGHADLIGERINRLLALAPEDDLSAEARRMVLEELQPRWERMRGTVQAVEEVPVGQHCVSPSDFGFHNALQRPGGVCFIDFEYAGMDDPAKLLCDFFWQPAVPVDWDLAAWFVSALDGCLGDEAWLAGRTSALFPAFGLKWCCILLNEFVRADVARRQFALGAADTLGRRRAQLEKARAMLPRIDAALENSPLG